MVIAHIVNPVIVEKTARFHFIQMVTFASMRTARSMAKGHVDIDFFSAQYAEDHAMVPEGFTATVNLERSIQDFGNFEDKRRLPLIIDILNRLYKVSNAEYFIYTNADICLMPHFYLYVNEEIQKGYDAFTINRRTISDCYLSLDQLPLMYADIGEPHRGWDCFVFRRNIFPKFILKEVCIGAPLVGLVLIANMIAWAEQFRQITDQHLTFHLGNDRKWQGNNLLAAHNKTQTTKILSELDQVIGGFPRTSPPGIYIANQSNFIRGFMYNMIRSFYIPAKWTRRIK